MKQHGRMAGVGRPGLGSIRQHVCPCAISALPFFMLFLLTVSGLGWAESPKAEGRPKAVDNGVSPVSAASNYTVDGLRNYTTVPGLEGTLYCTGSDGYSKVLPAWAEAFHSLYPGVKIKSTFKKSPDVIRALLKSEAQIALVSRIIRASEVDCLTDGFGYKPSWISALGEAIAVVVNRKNPVPGLSLRQIDAIFSKSLKRGGGTLLERWDEVGVEGALGKQKIVLLGTESKSSIYQFFEEEVLLDGAMRPGIRECGSSADLVEQVAQNEAAIGFCGLDALTNKVRGVPVGTQDTAFFTPEQDNITNGAYPLYRTFVMVFDRKPGHATDPLTYEFLKFVLSVEGQAIGRGNALFSVTLEEIRKAYRIID